jgi:hypothetical protein
LALISLYIMHSTLRYTAMVATSIAALASAVPNEQVMLANCVSPKDANFKSPWLGYYGDRGDQAPSATAQVQAPSGQTTWWEGASVSATFPDQDVFSVLITERTTTENAYVGTGKNNHGLFSCWRQSHPNVFTTSDSSFCSGIYVCNHDSNPSSGLKVQMTF